MSLLITLKEEAVRRGKLDAGDAIDAATAFALVRDMPYRRASDRRPETILREWQGTCSGKHYLLAALLKELGLHARVIACTSTAPIVAEAVPESHRSLYRAANGHFVDVHNYLLLELPEGGKMVIDATWPLSAEKDGYVVNEHFILGKDQQIAVTPLQSWPVPEDRDPQEFKNELLNTHFSPAELLFREEIIRAVSKSD